MTNALLISIANKISRWTIYAAVSLLPLFFLPWTANALDFNKQALLLILCLFSLIAWLAKSLLESRLEINLSEFNIPVAVLILVTCVSTIFSLYRYGSFWGWPLSINSAFMSVLIFGIAYFLITNVFRAAKDILILTVLAVVSGAVSIIFGALQIFGVFALPFDFARFSSFNTIGTVNSLGIFAAGILPLIIALFFIIAKHWLKSIIGILGLAVFVYLFLVNFWIVWIVMLAGMAVFLIFLVLRNELTDNRYLMLPMIAITLSLALLLFKPSIPGLPAMPPEISPSQQASLEIAGNVLKEKPIFGSGPGTFSYDYARFKTASINQTSFWAVRFGSASSQILENLATTGVLGALAFLSLLGFFLWLGARRFISFAVIKEKSAKPKKQSVKTAPTAVMDAQKHWQSILELGIFAGWFAITAGFFLYPASMSISWLFWLFTALFISLTGAKITTWKFEPSSPITVAVSFAFVLTLIFGVGVSYLYGQNYFSEVKYGQALRALNNGEIDTAINLMNAAIGLNYNNDVYGRDLAQAYLFKINETVRKTDIPREQLDKELQPIIMNTVNAVQHSVDVSSNNPLNWSAKGFIFRNLMALMDGADELAVSSYKEAIKLEPRNPFFYAEIGRVYFIKANLSAGATDKAQETNQSYASALENFEKSLEIKTDYAPAKYHISLVYAAQGKIKDAISKMEEARNDSPMDIDISFQLGAFYYQDQQMDKARAEFERIIAMSPNYSNAIYFLGLIYDQKGDKQAALKQFEALEKLNPDDQAIKKILDNLRNGKAALEGMMNTEQSPAQEAGPENPNQ